MRTERPDVDSKSPVFDDEITAEERSVQPKRSGSVRVPGKIHIRLSPDRINKMVEARVDRYIDQRLIKQPQNIKPDKPSAGTAPLYEKEESGRFCLTEKRSGKKYPVSNKLSVGRDPNKAQLAIPDNTTVSAKHAELTEKGGFLFVRDTGTQGTGSSNGTFINGVKITPQINVELVSGDVLRFSNSDDYVVERVK